MSLAHSAVCLYCSLQVSTENEEALQEVIDVLDGTNNCEGPDGHELRPIFP